MKQAPTFLLLLIVLIACEKDPINIGNLEPSPVDSLIYDEILGLLGSQPQTVLASAPGMLDFDTTSLGERQIGFALEPSNMQINATMMLFFEFSDNIVDEILLSNTSDIDDQELIYQLAILSDHQQWFDSEKHLLYYKNGSIEELEYFSNTSSLYSFISREDISKSKILLCSSEYGLDGRSVFLVYMGEYEDAGLGMFEPSGSLKCTPDAYGVIKKIREFYLK